MQPGVIPQAGQQHALGALPAERFEGVSHDFGRGYDTFSVQEVERTGTVARPRQATQFEDQIRSSQTGLSAKNAKTVLPSHRNTPLLFCQLPAVRGTFMTRYRTISDFTKPFENARNICIFTH